MATSSRPPITVKSIDHVVLTVKDISTTIAFYTTHLGMHHEKFPSKGDERHALSFGRQKINLHRAGHEFIPHAQNVQPGSEDLCFITECPIEEVKASWEEAGIKVG
jgi:catechol 2,3-dioxygenase-like lactoylglutathione lyase family enzyme